MEMKKESGTGQINYPVNFNLPFNGPDQGGSRVFNPLEELENSSFKVSFENSADSYQFGISSYHGGGQGPIWSENADESEFIETVGYFQYTDSDGKNYFITPTDGSQMLLLSATELSYHASRVFFEEQLGKEYSGGTLSFDWYYISDMPTFIEQYTVGAGVGAKFYLDNENTFIDSGFLAYESKGENPWNTDNLPDEEFFTGSSNGWQTQEIHLDPEISYDELWLDLGVHKAEFDSFEEDEFDEGGDVYLLVDNIQLTGLNDMMQFGQVENALWNNSDWSMGFLG